VKLTNNKALQFILWVTLLSSCQSYKQNLLFQTNGNVQSGKIKTAAMAAEKGYVIQKNDYLKIEVYTNKGERIIDPDFELLKGNGTQANIMNSRPEPEYLVQESGMVKLPMVGMVKLEGLTLQETDILLQKLFSTSYQDPFVITKYNNKRVIVLGAAGGQVVPLRNEHTSIIEVLALAGGLDNNAKAHNIRLIRGALDKPEVYVIDLSTISGMSKTIQHLQPGDIIYIEPVRRPVTESIRDIAPIISVITSTLALVVAFNSFNNKP